MKRKEKRPDSRLSVIIDGRCYGKYRSKIMAAYRDRQVRISQRGPTITLKVNDGRTETK